MITILNADMSAVNEPQLISLNASATGGRAISSDCALAIFILEYWDMHPSADCLALRVMLNWAAGRCEDAHKAVISAVVTIFDILPLSFSSSNDKAPIVISHATTAFLLVMIRQLQFILSVNSSPTTAAMISHRLRPALVTIIGLTIRIVVVFASLDYHYDTIQKLLRHPPKFPVSSVMTTLDVKSATEPVVNELDHWLKQNPIPRSDPGHLYFRPLSRADAIEALRGLPKGTFLIRPHEREANVVFLSFVTGSSDGVKHAIIRDEGSNSSEPSYRCGRVGPCATIDITLRSISKILPSRLSFDPDIVPGGVRSFAKPNITLDTVSGVAATPLESADPYGFVPSTKYGSFSGDIPAPRDDVSSSVKTVQELAWDPNGDFWWEVLQEEEDEISNVFVSYGASFAAARDVGRDVGDSVDSDREVDGVQVNTPREQPGESFMEAITAMRELEKKKGRGAGRTLDSKSPEGQGTQAGMPADKVGDDSGDDGDLEGKEELKRLKLKIQLYEQKELESNWNLPLASDMLGNLVRGVTHILSIKTVYKQISGQMDNLKAVLSDDPETERALCSVVMSKLSHRIPTELLPYLSATIKLDMQSISSRDTALKKWQSMERFKHSAETDVARGIANLKQEKEDVVARLTPIESLLVPLATFIYSQERVVMHGLCPPLPLDPTAFISVDASAGECLMEQVLHERIGVPLRQVKLPSAAGVSSAISAAASHHPHAAPGQVGGEHVVECFESGDVMQWISRHTDEATLQTIMHTKSGDVLQPEHVLKWLWDRRIVQNIVLEGQGVYSSRQHFFRYIDPWEVSIVVDQATVLSSARLGRGWYGPVSAYSAVSMVDMASRFMRMNNNSSDGGFVRLWEALRAEAWMVMSISTAHEQGEREAGGPVVTELTSSTLGACDPYHSCLARHLYRNALFSRLNMPHRFVAVLQIDTFALKDLAPQKFMSGVASTPIEVYAVLRLVRSGGRSKSSDGNRALADTLVTPARRIEANKVVVTSQPSEYAWREQAVMRFPLPDRVLSIGPFAEGGERNMRQPPRKLQLSIYETRSFFSDTKLGELELPLSGLSDDRPFRDWLPLSSEKGAAWFVHVQMQLRFLLMTKDSNKDSTIR